jgi:hypothetical protein
MRQLIPTSLLLLTPSSPSQFFSSGLALNHTLVRDYAATGVPNEYNEGGFKRFC